MADRQRKGRQACGEILARPQRARWARWRASYGKKT
jgi:hypothetical protein